MKLFEGKEVEGQLKGKWTLFVEGDVPFETIFLHWNKHTQLYFGAGKKSYINWDTVRRCLDLPFCTIMAEVADCIPFDIARNPTFYAMVWLQDIDLVVLEQVLESVKIMIDRTQLKFDTQNQTWLLPMKSGIMNYKSEVLNDVQLWEG